MTAGVPVCLTIGSSDSSGGAGIQGDIKAFASVGCYAATVLVGITAQNTSGVTGRWPVPVEAVAAQLRTVRDDLPIAAVKVGTTWSPELLAALAPELAGFAAQGVPVVVDPVMVTAAGSWLSADTDVTKAVIRDLFPSSVVITPNRREAGLLAGGDGSRRELAETITRLGAPTVVITPGPGESGDWFFDGERHAHLTSERHDNAAEHGVGCAHSALTAGLLAHGRPLDQAVREAGARAAAGVRAGLGHLGTRVHPVDVLGLVHRVPPVEGEVGGRWT
ncbi:bifunctional hydroxymethylpyrimidine kinase/phosphomethylpyrimidine kinase [Streptomyces paromomycinus]|uniref:Hydroxymethylpyrimidine/phosphomethylpyrimidine kinase n=1 Tax=Streptomyces paromomycinus TaxID=92743 RepID=A0A401VUI9_STREY|nr:bifunctional hydroxymethylpyrimidine kinase/phosphomethylpyrimidine kinase [Streptomyces paromomycinus]GCD40732.1 hydroxymethylpyrimidine/phosphomethylpyrimidine kinase [Streptomyces paromomycinus]